MGKFCIFSPIWNAIWHSICFPVSCWYRIVAYLSEAICQFSQYLQVVSMLQNSEKENRVLPGIHASAWQKYDLISEYLHKWMCVVRILASFFLADSSVQFSCSVVSDSVTPWIGARQASLSITSSRSWLRFTAIKSVIPSSQPHPLSSLSPPAPNPSQHQGLFQWVNSSHEVAKVLEFQL